MAAWTTKERATLIKAPEASYPSRRELAALIPRHPASSIMSFARALGLRNTKDNTEKWMRIAHEHFARREAEMRATP